MAEDIQSRWLTHLVTLNTRPAKNQHSSKYKHIECYVGEIGIFRLLQEGK